MPDRNNDWRDHSVRTRKEKSIIICFFCLVFFSFATLYTKISPLVIYNMDDWTFLSFSRSALPAWGSGNPSRILPEILMPFITQISACVIYPWTGRFVHSIETGMALFISIAVTAYAYFFFRLVIKRYKVSCYMGLALAFLFLVLHFLVFRTKNEGNDYLLAGYYDTTTFFFYLIPALLNASLVMYFLSENYFHTVREKSKTTRAIIILLCYLGIFSNAFQSGILAIYAGMETMVYIGKSRRNKCRILLKDILLQLYIIVLWIISLVFEFFGGRSEGIRPQNISALIEQIQAAGTVLVKRLTTVNTWFAILLLCSLVYWLSIFIRQLIRKKKEPDKGDKEISHKSGLFLILFFILLVYEWLFSGATLSRYARRGDVLICAFFFLFLFISEQLINISSYRKISLILPLVIVICFSQTFTAGRTWLIRTNGRIDAATAREITEDIVSSVQSASREGKTEADISVLLYNRGDNWPISYGGSNKVMTVLYTYGQINQKIDCTFVPDTEKNTQYGISIPK